jgi:endonuclease-3
LKNRIKKILEILEREYIKWDVPVKNLKQKNKKSPFYILISAMISTRTKDEVTKRAIEKFIKKVKRPCDVLLLKLSEIEEIIYPAGFYRIKAKNIKRVSEIIVKKYRGKVPSNLKELLKLPGVGKKVANIVLAEAFKKPVIAVDTHVARISRRMGFTKEKNPLKIEEDLERITDRNLRNKINYLFVALGQKICVPRNPGCNSCPVNRYCEKNI